MEPREQFTFYSSFAKAARRIKKPVERCAFYDAVVAFALNGDEPDLDKLPESVALAMELVMPVLISSRNKAANRANKRKQNGTNEEQSGETEEQTGKKKEKEREGEKEREEEKERENECSLPVAPLKAEEKQTPLPSPEAHFSGDLLSAVRDWLAYKQERREAYKPMGLQALFTQLRRAADENGEAAVVEIIRQSMASGYQGLTLDRLRKTGTKPRNGPVTAAEAAARPPQKPKSMEEWQRLLDSI